ncbi:MAG: DNRLRE domain-containing protein [Microgenomates group bacterium]
MNAKTLGIVLKKEITIPIYISGFTTSYTKRADFRISISSQVSSPAILINPTVDVHFSASMSVVSPTVSEVEYTITVESSSDDCTGASAATFSKTGDALYFGNISKLKYKTWAPFTLDFADDARGSHIVSATLKLMSNGSSPRSEGDPCKIVIGCDKNKTTKIFESTGIPVSWNTTAPTLNSKVTGIEIVSDVDVASWGDEELISIDVTNAIKEATRPGYVSSPNNADGITWTNGSYLGVILKDFGSSLNSVRVAASQELSVSDAVYNPPTLEIVYAPNVYSDAVSDTYIYSKIPTYPYYNEKQIIVGETSGVASSIYRGIMKFDIAQYNPYGTITAAVLHLYLEGVKASNTGAETLNLFPFKAAGDWDLNTASWNKKYGTANWTTAGGTSATDTDSTSIGALSLTKTTALGSKTIDLFAIDAGVTVKSWATAPSGNYGFMLKMGTLASTELNDAYIFSSSQSLTSANRPKLVITIGGTDYTIKL